MDLNAESKYYPKTAMWGGTDIGTFRVFYLSPQALFGGGGKYPNYVNNYLDFPNNMCQSAFDNSESFKS